MGLSWLAPPHCGADYATACRNHCVFLHVGKVTVLVILAIFIYSIAMGDRADNLEAGDPLASGLSFELDEDGATAGLSSGSKVSLAVIGLVFLMLVSRAS